jgi:RHS repeat-associated protein
VESPHPSGDGSTVTTSFTYDALGNVLTVTAPGNATTPAMATTFNYTTDGIYTKFAEVGQPVTITDNLGRQIRFRYDAQGRVTHMYDAGNYLTHYIYNLVGQVTEVSLPGTGQQAGTGRTRIVNTYCYVGGPVQKMEVFNEANTLIRTTNYIYDSNENVVEVFGDTEHVKYQYDGLQRLVGIENGNSNSVVSYGYYNDRNLLAGQSYAKETGLGSYATDYIQYEYADDGSVTQATYGNTVSQFSQGTLLPVRTVQYQHNDPDGLVTNILYPDEPDRNVTFLYDSLGRLAEEQDATGRRERGYNSAGVLDFVRTWYPNMSPIQLSFFYNADGSRSQLGTYWGNFNYNYDSVGRLASLVNPQAEQTDFAYFVTDMLQTLTQANGIKTNFAYNGLYQLTNQLTERLSNGADIARFWQMPYDGAGNRLGVKSSLPGASTYGGITNYTYDNQNRLTNETSTRVGGYSGNYAYDNAGNLSSFKGSSRTYGLQNQLLSGQGLGNGTNQAFEYDQRGNPTVYRGLSATFDLDNHLKSLGTVMSAEYRSDGLRAWKEDNSGNRTYYIYDGLMPIMEVGNTETLGTHVKAMNTFGGNGLISRYQYLNTPEAGDTVYSAGSTVFYVFDERGNTTARLDHTGAILSRHITDAYGVTLNAPALVGNLGGGVPDTTYLTDPYAGFGGKFGYYKDIETGLILCTFRYYDPETGRWINRDPIGISGGLNLYEYCSGNPITQVDPSGLTPPTTLIGGVAGGIAGFAGDYLGQLAGNGWNIGEVDTEQAVGALLKGAASGAAMGMSPATFGRGIVLGAAANGGSQMFSNLVDQIAGKNIPLGHNVGLSSALGGLFGGLGAGLNPSLKVGGELFHAPGSEGVLSAVSAFAGIAPTAIGCFLPEYDEPKKKSNPKNQKRAQRKNVPPTPPRAKSILDSPPNSIDRMVSQILSASPFN